MKPERVVVLGAGFDTMTGARRPGICSPSPHPEAGRIAHGVVLHRGPDELLTNAAAFIEDGLAVGEPTMAIFPSATLERLRSRLRSNAGRVRLEDMTLVGRNPARILPLLYEFAAGNAGPSRIVEQPLWGDRTEAEVAEVMCHESLVNLALEGCDFQLLCAYDVEAVDRRVLRDACRAHPQLHSLDGRRSDNPGFVTSPLAVGRALSLEEPSPPVEEITVTRELGSLRRRVASSAVTAPLSAPRREDLVLAVNEAAINALEYGTEPRTARLWRKGGSIVAEVIARGRLDDPLAGRRRPEPQASRGRGLWIANQLCDLVQLRHEGPMTRLRLHIHVAA